MFLLRAQHVSTGSRIAGWSRSSVAASPRNCGAHPWGVTELAVNRDLLATGRFALSQRHRCVRGRRTPFVIPGETDHPPPLDLPETARNGVVYPRRPPVRQPGARSGRQSATAHRGPLLAARLRGLRHPFRIASTGRVADRPAAGCNHARERRSLRLSMHRPGARHRSRSRPPRDVLDERWIAPAMTCSATPPLIWFASPKLSGMLNQRGEGDGGADEAAPGSRGASEVAGLSAAPGDQPLRRQLLAHWADARPGASRRPLPDAVFVQIAGELATFTDTTTSGAPAPTRPIGTRTCSVASRRLSPICAARCRRRHRGDPRCRCRCRSARHGAARRPDRRSLDSAGGSQLRADHGAGRHADRESAAAVPRPGQGNRPPSSRSATMSMSQLPGIAVRPMPTAPRQIPFYAGATYFELDRNSPHWQQMQSSGGFAIHVSGEYPNQRMDLWAIRGLSLRPLG